MFAIVPHTVNKLLERTCYYGNKMFLLFLKQKDFCTFSTIVIGNDYGTPEIFYICGRF